MATQFNQRKARKAFREPRKTAQLDQWYRKRLSEVADVVDKIASAYDEVDDPMEAAGLISKRLLDYSTTLDDWAKSISRTMITRAGAADLDVWMKVGKNLSKQTRALLRGAIGTQFDTLQSAQVELIKSLPREAAEKVHAWTRDGLDKGQLSASRASSAQIQRPVRSASHEQRQHAPVPTSPGLDAKPWALAITDGTPSATAMFALCTRSSTAPSSAGTIRPFAMSDVVEYLLGVTLGASLIVAAGLSHSLSKTLRN